MGSAVRFGGDPETRDLDEFFVVRRHRRSGVGRALATWLWDRHPTSWLVRVFQGNRPPVSFWREAISRYTGGHLVEEARSVEGRAWIYFRFSGGSREQVDRRSMDP